MRNILFVDDEVDILESLQDSLRSLRRRWNMQFACGGESAISHMAEGSFDVIVSDIRMPGVDGLEVLQYAKDNHPEILRIALTGYSDDSSTIKLTKLAQRYLTKPCSVDELNSVICRDSGLVTAFDLPVVREMAGSAGRLPAGDSVQRKLMECLNSDDTSAEDVADIIETDVALTAKILQLVNSSFFRRQSSIVSARHAVGYLGVEVIRTLLLADQLFSESEESQLPDEYDAKALYKHSMLCSSIAKSIVPTENLMSVSVTASLLHDVGKLIIANSRPELVPDLLCKVPGGNTEWVDSDTERKILGCSHSEVGGYILNLWGIPTEIVEAVTFHDNPSSVSTKSIDAVGVVHLANYLSHWVVQEDKDDLLDHKLDFDFVMKVDAMDKVVQWQEIALDVYSDFNSATH